ncbi:MAG: phoP 2 [Bacteroidetes bacterium]|jgi:two-component system alkaline phosphatase synthesis response regulator PhoP|nr:phoP 2 [Bacteroidota bacterium]
MKSSSILICDKDVYELITLKDQLGELGFNVITAVSKKELFEFLGRYKIEVLLMDLNLDDSDAIVLCQEIRSKKEIQQPYIIIYSDKNEDYIQITSFNSGADDFLIKPLKPIIISARIKAMLRRSQKAAAENMMPRKGIIIDKESYKIIKNNEMLALPRKEFEMLNLLFSNPNKVFSRTEIASEVWKDESVAKQRTIDIHIRNIRKLLGYEVIKTVKGIGYCIN